jgi:probable addiction module antidote protein
MKAVKTTFWDPAAYLKTEAEIVAYLEDVFSTNDTQLIVAAIGDVARAQGMSKIAEDTECSRESLYKSLSSSGNPSFDTILKVMSSLGYGLKPSPISANIY